jgi:hypothetical protein
MVDVSRTQGELKFIDQETRRLTTWWCREAVEQNTNEIVVNITRVYIDHAVSKKWVTLKEVTSDGQFRIRIKGGCWNTAAAFLKR